MVFYPNWGKDPSRKIKLIVFSVLSSIISKAEKIQIDNFVIKLKSLTNSNDLHGYIKYQKMTVEKAIKVSNENQESML